MHMQTKEQAQAAGDELKEILLRLVMTYDNAIRKLDGSEAHQQQTEFINGIVECVHKQILPRYAGRDILLYEKGRCVRSFDVERQRLWGRAVSLYLDGQKAATPEIEKLLNDPANSSILSELQNGLSRQIQTLTVPLLDKHETPGEDFYLHTYDLMVATDVGVAINNIADTGKTPPELPSAFFGMFGLLIQASRAEQQGDMGKAYSFLLDANHLIGMHEGARYAMKHLPEVAAKRRAKVNSAKSRAEIDKVKMRALELFYSLRPTDEDGKPQLWKSANVAMEAVWAALVAEAAAESKDEPGVRDSTVLSICRKLHKRDKEGSSLDIRVEVVMRLPDGAEIRIPVV